MIKDGMDTSVRPSFLWDEKLMTLAREVGDIIRKEEAEEMINEIRYATKNRE